MREYRNRFNEDPKSARKYDKTRAEKLLEKLIESRTREDALEALADFFDERLHYFSKLALTDKYLDVHMIKALFNNGFLDKLLPELENREEFLQNEAGRTQLRASLAEACRNFASPAYGAALYPNVDVGIDPDMKLEAIELPDYFDDYQPLNKNPDLFGQELPEPGDDPAFDACFRDPYSNAFLFDDNDECWVLSDGITYSRKSIKKNITYGNVEGQRLGVMKLALHRNQYPDFSRIRKVTGFTKKEIQFSDYEDYKGAPDHFMYNGNLADFFRYYLIFKDMQQFYSGIMQKLDPTFEPIINLDDSYQLANQLELLQGQLVKMHDLEEQNAQLEEAIADQRQIKLEREGRGDRPIVSCIEIVLACRQAMSDFLAKKDIAFEVDIVKRDFLSFDNENHRMDKLIKKLVCASSMKETLYYLYRHLHKESLNGYKIHLDSQALDTYILLEFHRRGLLEKIIGPDHFNIDSLRTEAQRKAAKTQLWMACDSSSMGNYALERLTELAPEEEVPEPVIHGFKM